ncbi:hypothetical protein [Paenibacillus contaminans]|uniref:Uncharacterized protein n=1 Tax=Paenibacillus contaminans TaxID=450362 RepID=A0A329MHL4_9BACL|nr:hypothetical protein [Paenibacillus contaminans]RAV19314.1 hypothetical protein DQG23_20150 [Paenibacillus contaminans]
MTNHFAINTNNQPVYTLATNTFRSPDIIATQESDASKAGSMYMVSATNAVTLGLLGGSVVITLQIANNSGSKTMYVSGVTGGIGVPLNLLSSLSGSLSLVSGGTLTAPSAATPANANLSSPNTSAMTARSSTSASTGGASFMALPLITGMFVVSLSGQIIVPPTKVLTVTVSASLSVAGTLNNTVNIAWWEI